jgi:predicted NBD/HSP70 family sugar kinase
VTLSGQIRAQTGTVLRSHRMGWEQPVSLAELMEEATGYRTMVEHDVTALTLAEQMFGLGQGKRSFAVVTAGRGIGAGMVIDYRLWRGMTGTAGELGHIPMAESMGRRCACGNRNCLETVAGSEGIMRTMREAGRSRPDDLREAAQLARDGDEAASRAFAGAGEVLGKGLATLVNLLNLELVVVRADRALRASGVYELAARRTFQEHGFYEAADLCRLEILDRDHQLGARSAGSMVLGLLSDRLTGLDEGNS